MRAQRAGFVTAAFVALVGLAQADDGPTPCPLDGAPLSRVTPPPWNLAGGIDSDGCRYAMDGDAQRRVVGLEGLLHHRGCRFTLAAPTPDLQLTAPRIEALRKALDAAGPGEPQRWELAAITLRAVRPDADAEVGACYLRAAWAIRGKAALGGADGGYRPRTLAEAKGQLDALEARTQTDVERAPEIRGLDASLSDLETLRASLQRGAGITGQRKHLKSLAVLAKTERRLLTDKRALLAELRARAGGDLSADQLLEALARAALRYGDPRRWERALERLEASPSTQPRAESLRAAAAEEGRLLGAALTAFLKAADSATGPERVRLLFLAGDCARRSGDARARELLERAARDGKGPIQERAALLLKD